LGRNFYGNGFTALMSVLELTQRLLLVVFLCRDFVDFIHNKTAQDLLLWTKKTLIPDETFFSMLNANPKLGIRGTYT
ncbi:unnamed protein product, partial [Candidula unifasciata]